MKALTALLTVSCLFLASCGDSGTSTDPGSDPAIKTTHQELDISFTIYNECCDEYIQLAGTRKYVYNDKGMLHINTSRLTGTGSNGNNYTGNSTSNRQYQTFDGDLRVYHATQRYVLTAPGGCQVMITVHRKIVYNAKGELIQDTYDYSTECKPKS